MPEQTKAESDHPWTFDEVLQRELDYIKRRRVSLGLASDIDSTVETTALCLSGGGVRSASFCLGVVRGLAKAYVLKNFDYLSTVSGGGYTGGFLSRWVREEGFENVEERLRSANEFANPSSPLHHFRKYVAYLTPRRGLLSLDTISTVALFMRNLLVNWLIIVPLFIGAVGIVLAGDAVFKLMHAFPSTEFPVSAILLGIMLIGVAISISVSNRPLLISEQFDPQFPNIRASYSVPIFVGTFPIALGMVSAIAQCQGVSECSLTSTDSHWKVFRDMATLLASFLLLVCLKAASELRAAQGEPESAGEAFKQWIRQARALAGAMQARLAAAVAMQAVTFIVIGYFIIAALAEWQPSELASLLFICSPAVFTTVLFLSEVAFVAIRGNPRGSFVEREWLARTTGELFTFPVMWAFASFAAIYGPDVLDKLLNTSGASSLITGTSTTGIAGTTAALVFAIIKAAQDNIEKIGKKFQAWKQWGARKLLSLLLPVFIFLLIVVFSRLCTATARLVADWNIPTILLRILEFVDGWLHYAVPLFDLPMLPVAPAKVILLALERSRSDLLFIPYILIAVIGLTFAVLVDRAVPTNVFTLHGIYRTRLVRAFIGAANRERVDGKVSGFVNLSVNDNIPLHLLSMHRPLQGSVPPQLHIINMAVNVPASGDLSIQERKALSFTASGIAVGSAQLGSKGTGSYWPSCDYARENGEPFSLGSAIAISGAAADPTMGYLSSAALSIYMAFFNIRLGAWLGNTAEEGANSYMMDGPRLNSQSLLQEAMGWANEKSEFIHLSDGGHFDNLGLYEALLRRCRFIIAVDASCDPEMTFESLAICERLAEMDHGATITFGDGAIKAIKGPALDRFGEASYALADIHYPSTDSKPASKGRLLYVKPRLLRNEQILISGYKDVRKEFPHESTLNQFFIESQFAAYLALGEAIISGLPFAVQAEIRQAFRRVPHPLMDER